MSIYKGGMLVGSTAKTCVVDTDPLVAVALGDQPGGNRPLRAGIALASHYC